MTPEDKEELQSNIANGVYRGNFQSKNGWDPGDPTPTNGDVVWYLLLMGVLAFMYFRSNYS